MSILSIVSNSCLLEDLQPRDKIDRLHGIDGLDRINMVYIYIYPYVYIYMVPLPRPIQKKYIYTYTPKLKAEAISSPKLQEPL